MNKLERKIKIDCKIAIAVLFFGIFAVCMLASCGDNNQPAQPLYNWSYTQDGFVQYRWMADGSCVIVTQGRQLVIPRGMRKGNNNLVGWKWERDGDIDINVSGRKYDLDSPFDPDDGGEAYGYNEDGYGYGDDEYYDDGGNGMMYAGGAAAVGAAGLHGLRRQKKVKVYGYDKMGNPLDRKGRILSKFDKKGNPVIFTDSKGGVIQNTTLNGKPGVNVPRAITPATTTTATTAVGGKTPAQLAAENKAMQAKIDRQKRELKRQQDANRRKNRKAKKQKPAKRR